MHCDLRKKTHRSQRLGWVEISKETSNETPDCQALGLGNKSLSAVVGGLAVGRDVQAFALVFFADTQTDGQVNELEGNNGDHT